MGDTPSRIPRMVHWPRAAMMLFGGTVVLVAAPALHGSTLFWIAWALQFLAWPHLALLRSLRSADSKRAEMHNVHFDALAVGIWSAVVQFQVGVTALLYGASALTHLALGGPPAFGLGALLFALGALLGAAGTGFQLQLESTLATNLLCYGGLLFVAWVIGTGTYRQNREVLGIKRVVELQKRSLEALLDTSTAIHQAADVDTLLARGIDGLAGVLNEPCCGVVLFDTHRPVSVRHAQFAGIAAEDGLRWVARQALDGDPAAPAVTLHHGARQVLLLRLAPQLKQLDGMLIVCSAAPLPADTLSLVQLFRDQMASALEGTLLNLKLQRLAHTDPLTGTFNRAYFALAFEQAVRNKQGPAQVDFAVVNIDANGLKSINDRFGHLAGDALIARVAELLRQTIRDSDLLCRIGGDEFIVLCNRCDTRQAQAVVERLLAAQQGAVLDLVHEGQPVQLPVSVSIGHASSDQVPVDQLSRVADERMYAHKQAFYRARGGRPAQA